MLALGTVQMGESSLAGIGTTTDYTGQERAALIAWHLAHGECLTTAQAAVMLRMTERGARFVLDAISRVIPIYCYRGEWRVCAYSETDD